MFLIQGGWRRDGETGLQTRSGSGERQTCCEKCNCLYDKIRARDRLQPSILSTLGIHKRMYFFLQDTLFGKELTLPKERGLVFAFGSWEVISKPLECPA